MAYSYSGTPSITDTIGNQNFVRYSKVSLTQGVSGVRGVSDSPEGMTPQSLAPKDQMTPTWKK